ncbi:polysaccharide biosynthesis tyrosine autokinase [Flagellimonas sp. HMM57]|uniref:GumC family protein n=1 Tax=unclassified Flagellimonas TaxID=2644544 RepID=UPI001F0A0A28|nr:MULTISPECIES: tyrosine-protein kinase [unclassified Flagellimonas]UII76113.1 polysaccharide biosynthesis tyrosine autokinase [Flagellimonas sp. HMM57]
MIVNSETKVPSSEGFDLNSFVKTYTRNWKWFALSAIFALSLAYVYLRYTPSEYAAQGKIIILDDRNSSSELGVFQDLEVFSGGNSSLVQDEIEVMKSRSNFIQIVKDLGLNINIIARGNILDSELYGTAPFKINFIEPDSVVYNSYTDFFISITDSTKFGFATDEEAPEKEYAFGQNIATPVGDIVLLPTNGDNLAGLKGKKYQVIINRVESVAEFYRSTISIVPTDKSSNIVSLYLEDPIQKKAQDVINSLITVYNKNTIADKKEVADRTSEFINDRITSIYSNLSSVDQSAEDFKTGRGITDIASEANINLNVGVATNQELQNSTLQLNIASSMKDIVDNQDGYEILPSNIGLSDPSIANTTARYNELVAERKRLLKNANEKNPIIVNLDQQLSGLKRNMQSSLNSMTNNLSLQVNSLSSQQSKINSRIYSAPKNERALRDITRQQQTTESLYLYLLQKREESQIAFASSSPKSKIIDSAYSSSSAPVYPQKRIVYVAALFLGLFLPFSIIYVTDLLDNKVHNKIGLEKIVDDTPVLAELPKLSKKENKLIYNEDRSVLAESLRILRTNLDYIIKSNKGAGKKNLIFITSSVSGEGKTFISSNLCMVFASSNKKVLLIGADIRNPKLYTFFSGKESDVLSKPKRSNNAGLTEYLVDDTLGTKDIVNTMLVNENEVDIIYSGKIPPNPSELLMSSRMKELFSEVSEKYDYVVVDTAPLMVVTDTLLISEYADHTLYVTRAGFTEEKVLDFPLKLKKEGKLKGLSFVVNDVKTLDLGYGGKYGYGYNKTLKKWWKF